MFDTRNGADEVLMIGVKIGSKSHRPRKASRTSGGSYEETRTMLTSQLRRLAPRLIDIKPYLHSRGA